MDLLEQDDPDWFLVRLSNGEIGLAPSNYVQDAEGGAPPQQQQQHEDYGEQEQQYEDEYQTPQASIPPPPVAPILTQPQVAASPPQPVVSQAVSSNQTLGLNDQKISSFFNILDGRNKQRSYCRRCTILASA